MDIYKPVEKYDDNQLGMQGIRTSAQSLYYSAAEAVGNFACRTISILERGEQSSPGSEDNLCSHWKKYPGSK